LKRIVYIASPYTKGSEAENVRRACLAGDVLLEHGIIPFVPHLTHLYHFISPKSYNTWIQLCLAYLGRCDAVLRLPGKSNGADIEVNAAQMMNMPVFFSIEELLEAKK
jgi:hypothetical protein